jgi:glucose-6-phosphate 1-dehydrogenase
MQPVADALVLFGATGDLSKRKLFPALYHLERRGRLNIPVIGVARSDWTDEAFKQHAHDSIIGADKDAAAATIDALCGRLDLIQGDYASLDTWNELSDTLDRHRSKNAVFYMAIPPSAFPMVASSLAGVGLNERGRIVVEKPFGRDLASSKELNTTLHEVFPEERIFRIDHYLGKESVEDLLVFRFSNTLFEPIWNRNYVRSVQITMSENIGVEGRGSFYDSVGAIRDVVQNHLLQVVALLAMEPPVGPESQYLQDEKAKVLAAMKFEIDSWRWAGVPFYARAGKGLAAGATEAVIEFKEPPRMLFDEAGGPTPSRNLIRMRLGKRDGVTFTLQAKTPGQHLDSEDVDVSVDFAAALGERSEAYERLLDDAIAGNPRRFARQDLVEQTWRVVQAALDEPGGVYPYERGTWGPPEADSIFDDPADTWYLPST